MKNNSWHHNWFNEDYLALYAYRDEAEAERQVEFILSHTKLPPSPKVLDLGCGTGRHVAALTRHRINVIGLDNSPTLLAKGEERLSNLTEHKALLIKGDMRDLSPLLPYAPFDLVINMFTSFGYFNKDTENLLVLQEIAKVLKPTGFFFIDYLHPNHVKDNLVTHEKQVIDGEPIEIHRKIEQHRCIKTIHFPGRTYQEKVQLYTPEKVVNLLTAAGLTPINQWGDYDGNPLNDLSPRQLYLCKVAS